MRIELSGLLATSFALRTSSRSVFWPNNMGQYSGPRLVEAWAPPLWSRPRAWALAFRQLAEGAFEQLWPLKKKRKRR